MWKIRNYNIHHRNIKNLKTLLQVAIHQYKEQPRRNRFLEWYKFPRLKQEERENMNRSIKVEKKKKKKQRKHNKNQLKKAENQA